MKTLLLIVALCIIVGLACIAVYLQVRVYLRRTKLAQSQQAIEAFVNDEREKHSDSIKIIARALLAKQVGAAEASIRISVLLDKLQIPHEQREAFIVFDKLREEIAHIPILSQWKALPKDKKKAFEKDIAKAEASYADFVNAAAQHILTQAF